MNERTLGPAYLDQVVEPTAYQVGPGDRFAINIWSEHPEQFNVLVSPEATIIVPGVGEFSLKGLTLSDVKGLITARLEEYYPRTPLSVTLTEVRRFRVTVTGAVDRPGLQVVTANTRASEVLEAAGLTDRADRRRIRLERHDSSQDVDLTAFERLGRRTANPYLSEGDVLIVPPHDARWGTIEISGAVNEPGRFGFSAGDSVSDLLALAYGLAPNADTTRVELWRFARDDVGARPVDWPPGTTFSAWAGLPLEADDRVIVRSREDFRPKRAVTVTGEVTRPGLYPFTGEIIMLREVIDSAGGFTAWADLDHALILHPGLPAWMQEHKTRVGLVPADLRSAAEEDWLLAEALSVPGRVATDFIRLFREGDESYNVPLTDGDQVVVPRVTAAINVIGRVVQPGLVPVKAGAALDYYVTRAGGYSWQADRGRTFLVKGATGAAIKKGRVGQIGAGDTVVVPTKRGRKWWTAFRETVTVVSSLATVYLVVDQVTR